MATVYFSGPSHPLSNLYPFSFSWKGHWFNSVEAAYQWEKASHHGCWVQADQIMTCSDPTFQVMRIGRSIATSSAWESTKVNCMYDLLCEKYQHCPAYRQALDGPQYFVEDTPHSFWGRGHSGHGLNWLGQLHQDIKLRVQSVLVLGSSHAKGMAAHLRNYLPCWFNIYEQPLNGATVQQVHQWVDRNDISGYHYIILITGSNDFYSKSGKPMGRGLAVHNRLEQLFQHVTHTASGSHLIRTEVLPRCSINSGKHEKIFKDQCQETRFCNNLLVSDVRLPQFWKSRKSGNPLYFSKDCVHLNIRGKKELAKAYSDFIMH